MVVKGIIFTDFVNYKYPCMTLMTPICKDFKCDRECGNQVCQNGALANSLNIDVERMDLINRYLKNDMLSLTIRQLIHRRNKGVSSRCKAQIY